MDSIGAIDWAIAAVTCFWSSAWAVLSNKQKDNDDFFLGGRNMHWCRSDCRCLRPPSVQLILWPAAEGAFGNYHQLLAIFFIPFVVIPITCIWFIPFYKGLGFVSLYEYLERRFSRPIR
ncbi:MAG: hypothetical protein CM1200mP2_59680 [Planctomycetaceae bacterium]|nr:MAG: hypothetical protein CM1200mP2_59680 [Planctomycetaceae bacterium]